MMRYSACCFLDSMRKVVSEIVWIVLPRLCQKELMSIRDTQRQDQRTISSARISFCTG